MSCVLRAIGSDFDVDGFLKDSELTGAAVFHRGEARAFGVTEGPRRAASGFNVEIGAASGDDLDALIQAAGRFLRRHEDELRRLGSFAGVEEVCLDFVLPRQEAAAPAVFPADFLWQTGALDIDLVVTDRGLAEGLKPA
jgi:hypothetical protein